VQSALHGHPIRTPVRARKHRGTCAHGHDRGCSDRDRRLRQLLRPHDRRRRAGCGRLLADDAVGVG
jgi:hypothetical protein